MSKTVGFATSQPLVSVVVVNYNSGDFLFQCVRSVLASTYPHKELIIVDNASEDDSLERVEISHPEVKVVRNSINLGYSAAGNVGIAMSSGEFVVIMNPDTVVHPNWLEPLIDATRRHPAAAFFQPKIVLMENPRVLNSAGNMIHIAGFGVCRGIGMLDSEGFQDESEISYASGACTLARRTALSDVGAMEELFVAYGEDKDLGWRALMRGWLSIYVPASRILHKWSPTFGAGPRKFELLEFERLLSIWKNYSRRTLILLASTLLVTEISVLVYALMKGWLGEKVRAYANLLSLRRVIAERRRVVQKRRILPDRVVIRRFVSEIEHPYIGSAGGVFNRLVGWLFACTRNSI
jgi:hypothetical protein